MILMGERALEGEAVGILRSTADKWAREHGAFVAGNFFQVRLALLSPRVI
jgi:hypothetical protein